MNTEAKNQRGNIQDVQRRIKMLQHKFIKLYKNSDYHQQRALLKLRDLILDLSVLSDKVDVDAYVCATITKEDVMDILDVESIFSEDVWEFVQYQFLDDLDDEVMGELANGMYSEENPYEFLEEMLNQDSKYARIKSNFNRTLSALGYQELD